MAKVTGLDPVHSGSNPLAPIDFLDFVSVARIQSPVR